jgi:hypothetical protein
MILGPLGGIEIYFFPLHSGNIIDVPSFLAEFRYFAKFLGISKHFIDAP